MHHRVGLLGNLLIGDAFWTWRNFLPAVDTWITAWCNESTVEVARAMHALTTLQIDQIRIITTPEAQKAVHMGYHDFEEWVARFVQKEPDVEYREYDFQHSFAPMPVRHHHVPGEYITLQLDSVHNWKVWPPIAFVKYPAPTWCIARPSERTYGPRFVGKSLTEVGRLLLGAKCHVGINSGVTVLAGLLGVPTVMCCWDPTYIDFLDVPDYMRILCQPTTRQIEDAMEAVCAVSSAANRPTS